MFGKEELKELDERKRLLLLEADLHRSLIELECVNLRKQFAPLGEARDRIAAGGPWLFAGSTIAGVLALRHWRSVIRWAPLAMSTMRWLKRFRGA
jgi:hypothetical protein